MPLSEAAEPRGAAAQRSPRPSPSAPLPCLGCSFCLLAPVLKPSMKSVVSASASGASCMVLRAVLGGAQPSPPPLLLLLYSSLSLFQIFFFFSLLPSGPLAGPRSAAAGRRRSRAALGAGGPAAPGAAHGARGADGPGSGPTGRDGGAARPPARLFACWLSLAFRLSPRRGGGRELSGLSLNKGRASRRKPALRSPLLPVCHLLFSLPANAEVPGFP